MLEKINLLAEANRVDRLYVYKKVGKLNGHTPVSYTHLDVYKRQEQDCPLQQLAQLPRRGVQYGRLPLCLLELLAGLQQNLGAVSLLSCLPGLAFDAQGQRTGHQAGYQHDGEGCLLYTSRCV